jgi:hypothetical protein
MRGGQKFAIKNTSYVLLLYCAIGMRVLYVQPSLWRFCVHRHSGFSELFADAPSIKCLFAVVHSVFIFISILRLHIRTICDYQTCILAEK